VIHLAPLFRTGLIESNLVPHATIRTGEKRLSFDRVLRKENRRLA